MEKNRFKEEFRKRMFSTPGVKGLSTGTENINGVHTSVIRIHGLESERVNILNVINDIGDSRLVFSITEGKIKFEHE